MQNITTTKRAYLPKYFTGLRDFQVLADLFSSTSHFLCFILSFAKYRSLIGRLWLRMRSEETRILMTVDVWNLCACCD